MTTMSLSLIHISESLWRSHSIPPPTSCPPPPALGLLPLRCLVTHRPGPRPLPPHAIPQSPLELCPISGLFRNPLITALNRAPSYFQWTWTPSRKLRYSPRLVPIPLLPLLLPNWDAAPSRFQPSRLRSHFMPSMPLCHPWQAYVIHLAQRYEMPLKKLKLLRLPSLTNSSSTPLVKHCEKRRRRLKTPWNNGSKTRSLMETNLPVRIDLSTLPPFR